VVKVCLILMCSDGEYWKFLKWDADVMTRVPGS
jgi:hypothetical protein